MRWHNKPLLSTATEASHPTGTGCLLSETEMAKKVLSTSSAHVDTYKNFVEFKANENLLAFHFSSFFTLKWHQFGICYLVRRARGLGLSTDPSCQEVVAGNPPPPPARGMRAATTSAGASGAAAGAGAQWSSTIG